MAEEALFVHRVFIKLLNGLLKITHPSYAGNAVYKVVVGFQIMRVECNAYPDRPARMGIDGEFKHFRRKIGRLYCIMLTEKGLKVFTLLH